MLEPKIIQSISDLQPDPENANLGTERGLRVLDDSFEWAADIGLPFCLERLSGMRLDCRKVAGA